MTEAWHKLTAASEIPAEGKLAIVAGGWHILLLRCGDGIQAVNDRCTHQASALSPGKFRRGSIMCPLHGARFDAVTGKCIGGAYPDLRSFPVRVVDGTIEVALPQEAPTIDDLPMGP